MRHPHIFARLFNCPLLLHPSKAEILERVFREHQAADLDIAANPEAAAAALRADASPSATQFQNRSDKPYALTRAGVAVIPIIGTLVQRSSWMNAQSGLCSYQHVDMQVTRAASDPDVKGILLEIDSFGGEANGCFDCADKIHAARQRKPVWAIVNESAYSAAYALASAAEKVYVPRSGSVGSIGVIALHVDQSEYDAKRGMKYTFIHAGERKKDFNSHEPLSTEARTAVQAEIDRLYGLFIDSVARMRAISPDTVRATQAGILSPAQAVEGGFVTGIATFGETLARLEASLISGAKGAPAPRAQAGPAIDRPAPASLAQSSPAIDAAAIFAARAAAVSDEEVQVPRIVHGGAAALPLGEIDVDNVFALRRAARHWPMEYQGNSEGADSIFAMRRAAAHRVPEQEGNHEDPSGVFAQRRAAVSSHRWNSSGRPEGTDAPSPSSDPGAFYARRRSQGKDPDQGGH